MTDDTFTVLSSVLDRMAGLIESLVLQADRYDAELASVRADIRRLDAILSTQGGEIARQRDRLHSVKVEP